MSSREPQAQLFTPAPLSDNPKMWAGDLGLLYPSQSTVQFKDLAALTAFLKTLGVDVDMNLTQLRSLPRFAQIGQVTPIELSADAASDAAPRDAAAATVAAASSAAAAAAAAPSSRTADVAKEETHDPPAHSSASAPSGIPGHTPVFKVSQRPGGGSAKIYALFGAEEPQAAPAAPSPVPRPSNPSPTTAAAAAHQPEATTTTAADDHVPVRKVRQRPGGGGAVASLFS